MSALENIFRPFQLPDNQPPRRVFDGSGSTGTQNVLLEIGKSGGGGKELSGSFSSSVSVYQGKVAVEKALFGQGLGFQPGQFFPVG